MPSSIPMSSPNKVPGENTEMCHSYILSVALGNKVSFSLFQSQALVLASFKVVVFMLEVEGGNGLILRLFIFVWGWFSKLTDLEAFFQTSTSYSF